MSARAALRTAVVLFWLAVIAYIISSKMVESLLPLELQEYLDTEAELPRSAQGWAVTIASFLVVAGLIVASIGLLTLQRWGAKMFLCLTILLCLLSCYVGPTVDHAVPAAVDYIAAMLHGAIIALAFFSNAFEPVKPPRPELQQGADAPSSNA